MKIRILTIPLLLVLGYVVSISSIVRSGDSRNGQDRSKLIKFSHQFHAEQVGTECKDCHAKAQTSESSADMLLPDMPTCNACHDRQTSRCGHCHTTSDSTKYGPFQKTERELRFSHKLHIGDGKLRCVDCHQGLDDVDYAAQSSNSMPAMDKCAKCHTVQTSGNSSASVDTSKKGTKIAGIPAASACEACHTDPVTLLPKSHKVSNFVQDHKNLARLGQNETNCVVCHSDNFCQECHDAAVIIQNAKLPANFSTPAAPKTSGNDNAKSLIVQKVHGLNYRFTHALDAKGRESDCVTCHDQRTFCAECHSRDGIENSKFIPVWHGGNDFVRLGRGSGGGRHATYARKDIEGCASCHDTNGNDPSCTTCHVDPDGIKGNDPKTHESGFDRSFHGSWHDDRNTVCYNCHTDANAHPGGKPGIGFCGYCHGHM